VMSDREVEIIARFLCRFSGEDPDATMYPSMGFQLSEAKERTADDNSPRWCGFSRSAEELWNLLQSEN
jgi:hypothetical protein